MSKFYRTVELIATVKLTFTVTEDGCEALYGVGLDALDSNAVVAAEDLWSALFEGDNEIVDHRFIVSDIQQADDDS